MQTGKSNIVSVDTGDPTKDRELTQWLKEDIAAKCKQEGIRIFGIALTIGTRQRSNSSTRVY